MYKKSTVNFILNVENKWIPKIGSKVRLLTVITLIQYCVQGTIQYNKASKTNKITKFEGRKGKQKKIRTKEKLI